MRLNTSASPTKRAGSTIWRTGPSAASLPSPPGLPVSFLAPALEQPMAPHYSQ